MKHIKKVVTLFLAFPMVLAMSVTSFAAKGDNHTISVPSSDTHKYDVYQILVGDLSDGKLSNVEWGSSVNAQDEGKINGKTATEFAKSLEGLSGVDVVSEVDKYFTKGDAKRVGQVDKDHTLRAVEGYYVMVDVTDPLTHGNVTDTKALNVIKLVADVEVDTKWGTSSDVKTIVADTLGKDTGENTFNPGASNDNVSIGDVVKYNIAATVPDNADKFKEGTFFFVITDKLSAGLTFNDDIKVYLGNSTTPLDASKYTVKKNVNGNTFEIGMINAAQYKGETINVKYSATVNEDAVIGDLGNPNTSKVKFSNDPNKTYDGSPEDQNNPGFPDSAKQVPTGETPDSTTITYVTGIEIQKVDENGEPLTGATFELSGQSTKKVVTKTVSFVADDTDAAKYWKLKDGTYTMTAPTEGNTMVPAQAGATKGYVIDAEATGDGVIEIEGTKYRPYVPATDAGKDLFVLDEGSKDAYDSTTQKYKKTVAEDDVLIATDHKVIQAVDANGIARYDGLGAGTYTIKETVTPAGYNTIEDIELTVTYNANGEAKFSVAGDNARYEDGVIKVEIVNKKGATLPSTGGIGTVIFYVLGSLLVVGCGIVLISKRRMNANK